MAELHFHHVKLAESSFGLAQQTPIMNGPIIIIGLGLLCLLICCKCWSEPAQAVATVSSIIPNSIGNVCGFCFCMSPAVSALLTWQRAGFVRARAMAVWQQTVSGAFIMYQLGSSQSPATTIEDELLITHPTRNGTVLPKHPSRFLFQLPVHAPMGLHACVRRARRHAGCRQRSHLTLWRSSVMMDPAPTPTGAP